jgi:hypothetical protein
MSQYYIVLLCVVSLYAIIYLLSDVVPWCVVHCVWRATSFFMLSRFRHCREGVIILQNYK